MSFNRVSKEYTCIVKLTVLLPVFAMWDTPLHLGPHVHAFTSRGCGRFTVCQFVWRELIPAGARLVMRFGCCRVSPPLFAKKLKKEYHCLVLFSSLSLVMGLVLGML